MYYHNEPLLFYFVVNKQNNIINKLRNILLYRMSILRKRLLFLKIHIKRDVHLSLIITMVTHLHRTLFRIINAICTLVFI
jgi:hypothetical protein